jgi:hypothetical protein
MFITTFAQNYSQTHKEMPDFPISGKHGYFFYFWLTHTLLSQLENYQILLLFSRMQMGNQIAKLRPDTGWRRRHFEAVVLQNLNCGK